MWVLKWVQESSIATNNGFAISKGVEVLTSLFALKMLTLL